jgi:hypothetical protein
LERVLDSLWKKATAQTGSSIDPDGRPDSQPGEEPSSDGDTGKSIDPGCSASYGARRPTSANRGPAWRAAPWRARGSKPRGIDREATGVLILFQRACEEEMMTVELARQLAALLRERQRSCLQ